MSWDAAPTGERGRHQTYSDPAIQTCRSMKVLLGMALRSRSLAADSWGGFEVPLAEEIEAYEVEILDGATVKRVPCNATTSSPMP